ncbi:MAG: DUF1858 domain-containing protein [Lachnospirales bacterium]
METLVITPKTKVYELLEAYPQLEATLVKCAPQFKKLSNPILRKTIAKVTTLSQAASVGGLKVEELVNTLRAEVGQSSQNFGGDAEGLQKKYNTEQADWYDADKITKEIDVRDMLNAGEHPVHEVMASIKALGEGEILKTIAPFIPAPLLDKTISLDYKHWIDQKGTEEFWIYFRK